MVKIPLELFYETLPNKRRTYTGVNC